MSLQQQSKINTGKGIPVLPPSPKPLMEKSRSLQLLGCLYTACPPQLLFYLYSHSLLDGRLQPSPSLDSSPPSSIPHIQPLSGAPNILWGSWSPLIVRKAPWASFFPYILGLACICYMPWDCGNAAHVMKPLAAEHQLRDWPKNHPEHDITGATPRKGAKWCFAGWNMMQEFLSR